MERALAEGYYSHPALEKLRLRQERHIQGPVSCGEMVQITLGRKHCPQPVWRRRTVTADEWEPIMKRFPEGYPAHNTLLLAYRCGFRLDEVLGLMWPDIDFEQADDYIEQADSDGRIRQAAGFSRP